MENKFSLCIIIVGQIYLKSAKANCGGMRQFVKESYLQQTVECVFGDDSLDTSQLVAAYLRNSFHRQISASAFGECGTNCLLSFECKAYALHSSSSNDRTCHVYKEQRSCDIGQLYDGNNQDSDMFVPESVFLDVDLFKSKSPDGMFVLY